MSAEISTIAEVNGAANIRPIPRTAAADGDDQHRQRVDPERGAVRDRWIIPWPTGR
jgi:hypothetical protein